MPTRTDLFNEPALLEAISEQQKKAEKVADDCLLIVKNLQHQSESLKYGENVIFRSGPLEIVYDTYGHNMTVTFSKYLILSTQLGKPTQFHGHEYALPMIEKLAAQAREVSQNKERIKVIRETFEFAAKWGVDAGMYLAGPLTPSDYDEKEAK